MAPSPDYARGGPIRPGYPLLMPRDPSESVITREQAMKISGPTFPAVKKSLSARRSDDGQRQR